MQIESFQILKWKVRDKYNSDSWFLFYSVSEQNAQHYYSFTMLQRISKWQKVQKYSCCHKQDLPNDCQLISNAILYFFPLLSALDNKNCGGKGLRPTATDHNFLCRLLLWFCINMSVHKPLFFQRQLTWSSVKSHLSWRMICSPACSWVCWSHWSLSDWSASTPLLS